MTAIFSNVVVNVDQDLKDKFPSDFDYGSMVQKLVDHAGLQIKTLQNGDSKDISLHGSWTNMTQVYTLLTTALRMYGATAVPKDDLKPQAMIVKSEVIIMPIVKDKVDSESDNELNTLADDTEDHNEYDPPENDTVESLSTQPRVLNTQPDSVAGAIMESCVLKTGDRKIHCAYVVLDKKICEDRIDCIDRDVKMHVANDSDHKIKKKRGRPRKLVTLSSIDTKDGIVCINSDTVQSSSVKPVLHTQLDKIASVTKNTDHASIHVLANGDDHKIKKKHRRPRKRAAVPSIDTKDGIVCINSDTVQSSSIKPSVPHTQLDNAALPETKNTDHASILANGDGIMHDSACEEGIDHLDMGTEMLVENDSDHTTIKKKAGLLVNEKKGLNAILTDPTSQLESTNTSNSRPGEKHSDNIKRKGRGRPCKFPVGDQSCDKCDFVGKDRCSLSVHRKRMHFGISTKCDVCHKVFPNHRYMKSHKASHAIRQHCCEVCGKIYKIRKRMLEHKKTHKDDYVKPYFSCDLCSKYYTNKYSLANHRKAEHMGEKKLHLCSICGKSFTTKTALREHADAHTGVKSNACEVCGKCFSYKSSLRIHKSIHDVEKQYICEICSKGFSQRHGLRVHMRIHGGVKQFVCTDCGAEFTQNHSLRIHERAHKGERPFICKLCSRDFGDSSIIRRHLKLVHKIHKDAKTWREDIMIISNVQDASYQTKAQNDDKEERSDGLLMDVKTVPDDIKSDPDEV